MKTIELKEFLPLQPNYPQVAPTDEYYCSVANKLASIWEKGDVFKKIPESVARRVSLCLTGYLQDIISDAGIWRSFINGCKKLYGFYVPFHEEPEEYIEYELNREDVRFLVWYAVAMNYEDMRDLYPHDAGLLAYADMLYDYLESIYEESPVPEEYNIARGLDLYDENDKEEIYHLGRWLSLHCYLMTPAFALTLREIISDPEIMKDKDYILLQKRLDAAVTEDPTGPLALFIPEWIRLIVEDKLPSESHDEGTENHPYYDRFVKATDGKEIAFFPTYKDLNDFFINSLGWETNQEHLPMMKSEKDFVALVNRRKGMLVARNVAKCIASPDNPYYDRDFALKNAIRMLTERGFCPADLVKYCFKHGYIRDASFPGSDGDTELVSKNWDLIARCYLQEYYRD